jgi:hypothetical protein
MENTGELSMPKYVVISIFKDVQDAAALLTLAQERNGIGVLHTHADDYDPPEMYGIFSSVSSTTKPHKKIQGGSPSTRLKAKSDCASASAQQLLADLPDEFNFSLAWLRTDKLGLKWDAKSLQAFLSKSVMAGHLKRLPTARAGSIDKVTWYKT